MNAYEQKRQAKIERLQERADKATNEANGLWKRGHDMASVIPFGQPILVGHHSESRDRNYRNRIQNTFRKASEATEKANHYAQKAASAAANNAISSDDPEAVVKLREKIEKAEALQEKMKAANRHLKAKNGPKRDELHKLGFTDAHIEGLLKPDFCGRIGFADYEITNNGANIRRMKQRMEQITAKSQDEETETVINGVKIVENIEENRCQIFFDGKPADAIRAALKSRGFRWSPHNGCWQRQRSNGATYAAQMIAGKLYLKKPSPR